MIEGLIRGFVRLLIEDSEKRRKEKAKLFYLGKTDARIYNKFNIEIPDFEKNGDSWKIVYRDRSEYKKKYWAKKKRSKKAMEEFRRKVSLQTSKRMKAYWENRKSQAQIK